ncbi:cobalt ABC transporter permease [Pseudonocardia sp. EC080610-09]|uniref:cobalt ECF transporter T component CbiQ n=1 Tax=unclassified Pseudonocardia TaxID=2619320 RepID=UPI000705A549|nr:MULTISPECIES: cobalt ECF transporter T component CbiQ [unclassified Pseudonocardia]ALL76798.1 cobalt ABC transporter permease [Pseudonocardia sp. EC080610-09]ALL83827.1 cobalt ABC transporter permease [Pseudonocardia sp. EC080619-01]
MGAGHTHPLHLAHDSPVHRLPPEVKIVSAFLVVVCVVATPREAFAVFGGFALLLVAVWTAARIPPGWILRRSLIELPFVVLAVLLPLTGPPPSVDVLGFALSGPGLLGAWNILIKGTLGVLTSLTLAATTPMRDLLAGLQRLRAPAIVTTIATLMLRYAEVIAGEARRMRLSRISRGHDPRFLWQAAATARGIGALFVRSYEGGERVHLAMLSRGWTGTMPPLGDTRTTARQWVAGLSAAAVALVLAGSGWLLT